MPWFTAHVIMYFRRKVGLQRHFAVWENVHVLEAADHAAALVRAEWLGRQAEGDASGTLFEIDDAGMSHATTCVFAGVRKILTVAHSREDERLASDDEVTYSSFLVDDEETIRRLASGETVAVTYTSG